MAIRVGRWDCNVCGHKGNLGPHTNCDSCGAPRPQNVRFYLGDNPLIVTDAKKLREAMAGVDWICGHCESQNKALNKECWSCGNPRDDLSQDVNLQERVYRTGEEPREGGEFEQRTARDDYYDKYHRPKKTPWLLYSVIGIALFALLLGGLVSISKEIDVTVKAFSWERNIQLEHYEPVAKEAWSLPGGAYDVRRFKAIHHYDKVFMGYEKRQRRVSVAVGSERYVCGQRDMGNGYFRDEYCNRTLYQDRMETYDEAIYNNVPVYKTRYAFYIKEWVSKHTIRAADKNQKPRWPVEPHPDPDNWRDGLKTHEYTLIIERPNGKQLEEVVGYNYWKSLKPGSKIKATKSRFFGFYFGLASENKDR